MQCAIACSPEQSEDVFSRLLAAVNSSTLVFSFSSSTCVLCWSTSISILYKHKLCLCDLYYAKEGNRIGYSNNKLSIIFGSSKEHCVLRYLMHRRVGKGNDSLLSHSVTTKQQTMYCNEELYLILCVYSQWAESHDMTHHQMSFKTYKSHNKISNSTMFCTLMRPHC